MPTSHLVRSVAGLVLITATVATGEQPAAQKPLPDGSVARLGNTRLRHAALPRCVVFSPDGKRVFSGGEDGVLRVWDAATGDAVNVLAFPDGTVSHLRLTHRGSRLAVQLSDNRVRLLDIDTLKERGTFSFPQGDGFAVSHDGDRFATVTGSGLLTVTDTKTRLDLLELAPGYPFTFHPNGKVFAVAGPTGKVTFHLIAGGKPVLTLDHGRRVNSFAFSPNGKRLATGGATGAADTVKLWEVADGKAAKLLAELKDAGRVKAWLDDDHIAAGDGFNAGVYDLAAKKWTARIKGVTGEWAISPDGTTIATTGTGGLRVRMFDLTTGKQLHAENDTFPQVSLLAPTADGTALFLIANDSAFSWVVGKPGASPAGSLPGKSLLATTGAGRLAVTTPEAVLVYDAFDPAKALPPKPARTLTEHAAGCRSLAVSPDGKRVAYSGEAARIVIADAAAGKTLRVLPVQTIGLALAFTPNGETLAMIGRDGFLRMWATKPGAGDPDENLWKVRIQRGQRGTLAFSPDGKHLAASSSGTVKIVTTTTGREEFSLGGLFDNGLFEQVAFSPDGRLLITASEGTSGGVRVWEIATRSLVRRFATGFGTVSRFGLFPDGSRIASTGAEEVITVWDLTGRHGKNPPKANELLMAWGDLDSLDGAKGYPATLTLTAGGPKAVEVIATGLNDVLDTQKRAAGWVKQLGSENLAEREAATKGLFGLGIRTLSAVQAAAVSSDSAEIRTRATELIDKFTAKGLRVPDHGLAGDTLRLYRAVQVLEDVGGADAKALLGRIATLGGPVGDSAKAALKRTAKP